MTNIVHAKQTSNCTMLYLIVDGTRIQPEASRAVN